MPVPTLPPLSPRVVVAPEHATSQVRRLQMLNLSPRVAASGGKIGLFNYNSHPHASVKSPRAMPHARTHTFTRGLMRHAEPPPPEDSERTLARIPSHTLVEVRVYAWSKSLLTDGLGCVPHVCLHRSHRGPSFVDRRHE